MYKKELDSYLLKSAPRACLLYGESRFLIERYSRKIASMLSPNRYSFYYSEYALEPVVEILSQSNLFGDSAVVVLKLDKKLDKKHIDSILSAIKRNPSNAIVIEFHCADNKSPSEYARDFKAFAQAFKGEGVVEARFFEPSQREALDFMTQEAKRLNINISAQNLNFLLLMQDFDVSLAIGELEKFVVLDSEVRFDDIKRLCYGLGSIGVDELLEGIFKKSQVLEIGEKLLDEGFSELELLNALEHYFYQLFLFFSYIRKNGKVDAKEILGFTPPQLVASRYAERAIKIKEEMYLEIFKLFGKWRNSLMSGEKSATLHTLIKIQEYIC